MCIAWQLGTNPSYSSSSSFRRVHAFARALWHRAARSHGGGATGVRGRDHRRDATSQARLTETND
eukprot:6203207-Pleurochrysis_carterae.AAC.2